MSQSGIFAAAEFSDAIAETLRKDYTTAFGEVEGAQHWDSIRARLVRPPAATTLRIHDYALQGDETKLQELVRTPFKVHDALPDLLLLDVIGPQTVEPCKKQVMVDYMCGMSVLRGSHVYQPGIKGSRHLLLLPARSPSYLLPSSLCEMSRGHRS